MAIERINVDLGNTLLPADVQFSVQQGAQQLQEKLADDDKDAAVRRAADKKVAEKHDQLKQSVVQRETFARESDTQQRLQRVIGGDAGPEAANALRGWNDNAQLQGKLTQAQKNLFREAMAHAPQRATDAGQALGRLSAQPGFGRAINTSQQMGTLHAGVLENPHATEKPASAMLQSRFMQSPKADAQAKNQYLGWGLKQAQKGQLDSVKKAGDMLGSLSGASMPARTQRSAMNMVQRTNGDASAMASVDSFVQKPGVRGLPASARASATDTLIKASGKLEVHDSLEALAHEPKLNAQSAQNKGRWFATVGSGRPSDIQALVQTSTQALRSPEFPTRSAQVTKFLNKLSTQAQSGAGTINASAAMREAKRSPMPTAPRFVSTEGLDDEEAAHARSQNRAQLLNYCNQLDRIYEQGGKQLNKAKYLDDVNAVMCFREPPAVDVSNLDSENQSLFDGRMKDLGQKRTGLLKLHQQKSRELRNKRLKPGERAARQKAKAERPRGPQPAYCRPEQGGARAAQLFASGGALSASRASAMPSSPARAVAQRSAAAGLAESSGALEAHVSQAVSQFSQGPMTAERATQVAEAVALKVAQQVTAQLTQQLLGNVALAAAPQSASAASVTDVAAASARVTVGKTDGWGIKRTFDRDLGGTQGAVVKPPSADEGASSAAANTAVQNERYTGKMLVKDPGSIRALSDIFATRWKELAKPEQALLKNLGWGQQAWDTKETPAAQWPRLMFTAFINLTPVQREAVRKLGFSAHDWDTRVQAMTMGKNA